MFIGIDFGTSKSVVGVWNENRPTIIPDPQGRHSMPSLVMVAPDESLYIGWDALNHPSRYQGEYFTISSIKRLIGKAGETSWGKFRTYPQEVSALILGRLKMQAELYYGSEITGAVIAVPAHYDINQRWATIQAAEISGLKFCRLVNEATAATVTYSSVHKTKEGHVIVFDFGGGTLDVSIVEIGEGVCEVKATSGDDRLGGDDFDQAIYDYVLEKITKNVGTNVELSQIQKLILKESVTRAKIELSEATTTRIFLPGFIKAAKKFLDLDIPLDRRKIESLWESLLNRTEVVVRQVIKDTCISQFEDLILIGGTSRIPSVRDRVRKLISSNPSLGLDAELCVAQGASILGGVFKGKAKDLLLLDAIPRSYLIEKMGGVCETILERNTTFPTKKSKIFTTTTDNQTEVTIRVYEGEGITPAENTFVGELRLTDLPPSPKGIPQIEVTFDIDANNVFRVSAEEIKSGRLIQAVMESPYRMNAAQIKVLQRKVLQEIESLKERERNLQEEIQVAILRDKALLSAKKIDDLLEIYGTSLEAGQVYLLSSGKQLIYDYLDRNISSNDIKSLLSSIKYTFEDTLISLILSTLRSLASPELAQWVNERITSRLTPVFVDKFVKDFDKKFSDNIGAVKKLIGMLFRNGDVSPIGQIQERLIAKVKNMPSEFSLLAMVVSRYAGLNIFVTGLETQEIHSRFLLCVFLLNELRSSYREEAAKGIYNLYKGKDCIFLCDYLRQYHTAAPFLEKCLGEMPGGILIKKYHDSNPDEREWFKNNLFAFEQLRRDLVWGVKSPTPEVQVLSLKLFEELGIQECLRDMIQLLEIRIDEDLKIRLISLVAASRQKIAIIPLIRVLADQSPGVKNAALIALEGLKELMPPDIGRFFELFKRVVNQKKPIRFHEKFFLKQFAKEHKDLGDVVQKLMKKE